MNRVQRLGRGVHTDLAIGVTRDTLARYVPRLTTFVAYFADCIQGTSVGSGTVARNMALVISVTLAVLLCHKLHVQVFRMHSISSLGLDSLERSDLVHHICSRWLGEDSQRNLHGSHPRSLREAQKPHDQYSWVQAEILQHLGKHAYSLSTKELGRIPRETDGKMTGLATRIATSTSGSST